MKPPAASPGRAEKPQLPAPAPPGLARLLLSKSRRGGRSRRAPATSPMFVSRGRSRTAADGEPSSPKVTCIGQVRMRKGKKGKKPGVKAAAVPEKGAAKGYCRCLKKAFLCGGLFEFDSRRRKQKAPSPEVERPRRSPWVFSSRDVAVAAAPKAAAADPRSGIRGDGHENDEEEEEMQVGIGVFGSIGREEGEKMGIGVGSGSEKEEEDEREAQLVSSATTTPPKNALLLMRCRSAPQNRTSPLTSRFPAAAPAPAMPSPSPTRDALAAVALEIVSSPSPSPSPRKPEKASPSPRRKPSAEKVLVVLADEDGGEKRQGGAAAAADEEQDARLIGGQEEEEEEEEDEFEEEDELRCSSARPLVLQRCKSEPATTAAAKMATGGPGADATTAGCFWAHGGSSGRRRHAPPGAGAPVALAGH